MGEDLPALGSINSPVRSILKELLYTARRRKSGSYPVLYEAYSSMKLCPIQFTSVRQLLPLGGFGQALVDKIELMLREWCREHGKRYVEVQSSSAAAARHITLDSEEDEEQEQGNEDEDEGETDSDLDTRLPSKRAKDKAKAKSAMPKASKQSKKKAEKEPKVFVPQHRSGTHGILVSLYTLTPDMPAEEIEGTEAASGAFYYSKATVIHFAQPYSTSKYIPKESSMPGSGHASFHCAWSGMKTLINRGYVYRRGNPARFCLSRQGWQVAQTCTEREKGLAAGCNEGKVDELTSSTDMEPSKKTKKSTTRKEAPAEIALPFLYTYLDQSQPPKQTTSRTEASLRLSDRDYRMLYKITFSKSLAEHPFVRACVEDMTESGELVCGWVREAVCNEIAPGIAGAGGPSRKSQVVKPLPKAVTSKTATEPQTATDECRKVLQAHISNSQSNVIELLTSSDVEVEVQPKQIKVNIKAKPPRRRQDSDDSDSELSDLAPIVKQRKTAKTSK